MSGIFTFKSAARMAVPLVKILILSEAIYFFNAKNAKIFYRLCVFKFAKAFHLIKIWFIGCFGVALPDGYVIQKDSGREALLPAQN